MTTLILCIESVMVKPMVRANTIGKASVENNVLSPLIAPIIEITCLCLSVSYGRRESKTPVKIKTVPNNCKIRKKYSFPQMNNKRYRSYFVFSFKHLSKSFPMTPIRFLKNLFFMNFTVYRVLNI